MNNIEKIQNIILFNNLNGKNFTVKDYVEARDNNKKDILADFVYNRLYSRYIEPFENLDKNYKNGFPMMASFCLLIETIQSFKEGFGNSKGKSGNLFKIFFKEQKSYFEGIDWQEFYNNVRCGILHQGETTGGWRLRREENKKVGDKEFKILSENKTIQVNNFMNALREVLEQYKNDLKKADWEDEIWLYFKYKMNFIIKNCK